MPRLLGVVIVTGVFLSCQVCQVLYYLYYTSQVPHFSRRIAFLTAIPAVFPTTASPTTASPTTASPTTAFPTTAFPTTAFPTTAFPTTASRLPTDNNRISRCSYRDFGRGVLSKCEYNGTLAMLDELQRVEQMWGVRFIVMHGSLIGQVMNNELLPWDKDLDVSILDTDEPALQAYLRSLRSYTTPRLHPHEKSRSLRFFAAGVPDEPLEWYHDTAVSHHIEYRLIAPNRCDPRRPPYTDVTVLYRHGEATRRNLHPEQHWMMKANLFNLWGGHIYDNNQLLPLTRCRLHHVDLNCPHTPHEVLKLEYANFERPQYKNFIFQDNCWCIKTYQMSKKKFNSPSHWRQKYLVKGDKR